MAEITPEAGVSAMPKHGERRGGSAAVFAGGETPFAAALAVRVFGAHTYERVDQPRGEFFPTRWTGIGGRVVSGSCTV